jgi:hypothetical protein
MKPIMQIVSRIGLALLAVLTLSPVNAETRLDVARTNGSMLSISMSNHEPVAALQFTLNVSSNVEIVGIEKGERLGAGWQLYSHQVDGTTLNVVVIHTAGLAMNVGSGVLTRVEIRVEGGTLSQAYLTRVVLANPSAESITYSASKLEWNPGDDIDTRFTAELEQNYPNPFNPMTTVRYSLLQPGNVRLTIYDMTGREVKRLVDQYQLVGSYSAQWDGRDDGGLTLPSGSYIARLQTAGSAATVRMMLVK